MAAKKITTAALLTAAALIIFVIEAQLPPLLPLPGVKLGLANVITLIALFIVGPAMTSLVLIARIILGGLITGQAAAIVFSMAGGLPALVLCVCIYRFFKRDQLFVISVISAVIHNLGQITAAALMTTAAVFAYLPILIVSGIITGLFTGLCAQFMLAHRERAGILNTDRQDR